MREVDKKLFLPVRRFLFIFSRRLTNHSQHCVEWILRRRFINFHLSLFMRNFHYQQANKKHRKYKRNL